MTAPEASCKGHLYFRREPDGWYDQHGRKHTLSQVVDACQAHAGGKCLLPMLPPMRPPAEEDPFHTPSPVTLFRDFPPVRKAKRICGLDTLRTNPDGTIEFIRGDGCECDRKDREKGEAS